MTSPPIRALCISRREQEQHLRQELKLLNKALIVEEIARQAITVRAEKDTDFLGLPIFFATQTLPDPKLISAESINLWAKAIYSVLEQTQSTLLSGWCLHIFDPLTADTGEMYARPQRIREATLDILKQKNRSLRKSLIEQLKRESSLVQVALLSPTTGMISVADPALRETYGAFMSQSIAGFTDVADDKRPPSRAFKKLREAIITFDLTIKPHDQAVDLGASPGGWTHVLREYGASVIAIDRSPLDPHLMRDKKVKFIQGNALTWEPPHPVDWVVCDVITTPENTRELLKRWISNRWCSHFCVTIKFKGSPAFEVLREISQFLHAHTTWFRGRQLTHNKNEVTVVGIVA
jgi:23S rRNA C2498 (ribose-2'-O)-methylase RlmM